MLWFGSLGAVWGYFASDSPEAAAVCGGMLGALVGLVFVLLCGMIIGAAAWFVDLFARLFRRGDSTALLYGAEDEVEAVEDECRARWGSDSIYDPNR